MVIPNYDKLREMIARWEWTFAKTMPFAPHEYIVRDKCPLITAVIDAAVCGTNQTCAGGRVRFPRHC